MFRMPIENACKILIFNVKIHKGGQSYTEVPLYITAQWNFLYSVSEVDQVNGFAQGPNDTACQYWHLNPQTSL